MSKNLPIIPGFKYWSSSKNNSNILLYHSSSYLCLDIEKESMNTITCEECQEHRNGYDAMVGEHETKFGNYSQGYCNICINYEGGCIPFEMYLNNCDRCYDHRCIGFQQVNNLNTVTLHNGKYIIHFPNNDVIMPSNTKGVIVIGYDIYDRPYYSYHNVNRYTISKGIILYWESMVEPIKHKRVNIEHDNIIDEFY